MESHNGVTQELSGEPNLRELESHRRHSSDRLRDFDSWPEGVVLLARQIINATR